MEWEAASANLSSSNEVILYHLSINWTEYLRNHLSPIGLSCLTYAGRRSLLQTPSAKEFRLVRSRRAFSDMASILWDILLREMRLISFLLAFRKSLKTWHGALKEKLLVGDGAVTEKVPPLLCTNPWFFSLFQFFY